MRYSLLLVLTLCTAAWGGAEAAPEPGAPVRPAAPPLPDEVLQYYTHQSARSDPGAYAKLYDTLPDDVSALVSVVQGLLMHGALVEFYGYHPSKERTEANDAQVKTVEEMLKRLQALDARPLTVTRPPEKRLLVCCRQIALLLCSFLRAKHIPARVRCGYSTYTYGRGKFDNHWICEYWLAKERRWVRVDPQIDPMQRDLLGIKFDTLDVPPGSYLPAGQGWQRCRNGDVTPDRFGVGGPDWKGGDFGFVASDTIRDFLCLNEYELLPWELTPQLEQMIRRLDQTDLALVDHFAELAASADVHFHLLRAEFEAMPGLRQAVKAK